jgi:hypothetical protein
MAVRRTLQTVLLFLAGSAVFAVSYCQAPLYYSNQNQYFLHGLAQAGVGHLQEDWLANTLDPTPIFSGLVTFTIRYLHPVAFYLFYSFLLGCYAAAMLGLFIAVVGEQLAARRWPIFVALFVLVHSALPRWCSYHWLGQDYPWFLQTGLAGQYILGPMFQPSVFGVLLVVAVCLFLRSHPYLAGVCAALAATLHFTYLLLAGLLVFGFLVTLLVQRRLAVAVGVGALSFVLVLPTVAQVLLTFGPTSAETFARAEDILVNFRIPHHTRPDLWLDGFAVLQISWLVLGVVLAWRKDFILVLGIPAGLALPLTLVQVATGSHTLALLFPWRISAVLAPIATTVILARLTAAWPFSLDGWVTRVLSALAVVVCMAGGVWISAAHLGFHTNNEELPLLDFVRQSQSSGDLYFLPVHVSKPAKKLWGNSSSDFKPLLEKQQDSRLIPGDLQRFRLYTGVPIFVDFKAVPYKDTEVLEWYQRMKLAQMVQGRLQEGKLTEALAELRLQQVTHLVVPAELNLANPGIAEVYEDANYRVFRLVSAEKE